MGRRKILLVVAVVVAALGAALVFLYVQAPRTAPRTKFDTVDVLVVEDGDRARRDRRHGVRERQDRHPAGAAGTGARRRHLRRRRVHRPGRADHDLPGEQLIPEKFGGADEVEAETTLPIPEGKIAISVNLSDTARVGPFIRPGAKVGIFLTGTLPPENVPTTKLLMRDVIVLAAGSTTAVDHRTAEGEATTDGAAAQHAVHAGAQPEAGREGPVRPGSRRAGLRAAQREQRGQAGRGRPRRRPLRGVSD